MIPHLAFRALADDAMPWVFGTFAESLRATRDIRAEDRLLYEHALKRLLKEPVTKAVALTPNGEPGELMGWAVATPTSLVYAYVRYPYRRGKLGAHLGTALIREVYAGEAAAIWTVDASRMAAAGFKLRYDLDQHEAFKQLAR